MKKSLSLLLLGLFLTSFTTLSARRDEIKILCFGNSFTHDAFAYVPFILEDICPEAEVTIGIAYIPGCPLVQHLVNFTEQPQVLDEKEYKVRPYDFFVSKNGKAWKCKKNCNVDEILSSDEWDLVTFQQNGRKAFADYEVYFQPYLDRLTSSLFNKLDGRSIQLGWLLTHGSYAEDKAGYEAHWRGTALNSERVMSSSAFSVLFPSGTAVQNLRTTALGDKGAGGNLTADHSHLQEGLPCLATAYTNALRILELMGIRKTGIFGNGIRPDKEWIRKRNIPGQNYGKGGKVLEINDRNCYLAQIAAVQALRSPYEVTPLTGY